MRVAYVASRDPDSPCSVLVRDLAHPGAAGTPLPPRNDIRDHSPGGFQWGYGGSGPAQLALALCVHALNTEYPGQADTPQLRARAIHAYQDVKARLIAQIEADRWAIDHAAVMDAIRLSEAGPIPARPCSDCQQPTRDVCGDCSETALCCPCADNGRYACRRCQDVAVAAIAGRYR